jgi:hypothetical protein
MKYMPLLPELKNFDTESADILPIVFGTREAMPEFTIKNLAILGIKEINYLKTISLTFFRCSIQIYNNFMDYNIAPLCRRRGSL